MRSANTRNGSLNVKAMVVDLLVADATLVALPSIQDGDRERPRVSNRHQLQAEDSTRSSN
jgi:hypothetical protein